MSTPAERYAAARLRSRYPAFGGFAGQYAFTLDEFQSDACHALEDGQSLLVCAPTGAGKTVVGEFAVHLALESGQRCFYTTPIKALSNQKYNDLVARYGPERIGLLTGDNAVNGDAPVVVMTTEVLRNMLYVGRGAIADLGYVVMDEVHYLGDRFRGAVWEEVIIHLAASVRLVALSATVSNAEEFGEWLVSVRGRTAVIVHERRPVPLWQHVLVGTRLFDLFEPDGSDSAHEGRVEPGLRRYLSERMQGFEARPSRGRGHGHRPFHSYRPARRADVIERLDRDGLLPAITFVFSRVGCDAAVRQCVQAGLWLTDVDERAEIDALVEERTAGLPDDDLAVLGYWDWREGLRRGVAAHHAGMLPVFKETVEELFVRGLVRAVFATETLALGINMPARSVVLERLSKFNGEAHVELTPGEYTQLTGRAGRRGIDIEGHAVVVWTPEVDIGRVAGLASTRTYPLRSSFRPSYNMAVNLVGQMGRANGRALLDSSFAQFQADRGVAGLLAQVRRSEIEQADLAGKMRCHLGDFAEYAELRQRLSAREAALARQARGDRRAAVVASLERLRPGDVIRVPSGRRAGVAVVIDPGLPAAAYGRAAAEPRPLVVTDQRWGGRLSALDFPEAAEVLGRVRVPKHVDHRSPQQRRDLASSLRALDLAPPTRRRARGSGAAADDEVQRLRAALRAHPCHGCADREEHARWARRWERSRQQADELRSRAEGHTGSLGRTFDRICALLDERGFLAGDEATSAGRGLARIWSEQDLLVAECVRHGAWDGLDPAELAAVVSAIVYEPRREERPVRGMPTDAVRDALAETTRLWAALSADEDRLGLPGSRGPELGFVRAAHRWARGQSLARALEAAGGPDTELAPGDFIRCCKQLIDLLGQLGDAAAASGHSGPGAPGSALAHTARSALQAVRRGVVAQSMQT